MRKCVNFQREHLFVIIISAVFAMLFINRLFYGIETSDEAYYEATGYRLMQGNVPYGDMWEVNAGGAYIMAPFLFIHKAIHGGTEGLHLFLRISFLVLQMIGMVILYMYAKRGIVKSVAFLLSVAFLFHAPFSLYNFSYNNMSALFMSASVCMLLVRLHEEKKIYEYLTGVFMALAVLVYPTMIYCCVAVASIIIVLLWGRKGINYLILYVAGGLTIAVPVLLHLAVKVGLMDVVGNLMTMLSSGATPSLGASRLLMCIYNGLAFFKTPFAKFGMLFFIYYSAILGLGFFPKTKRLGKYLAMLYPLVCYHFCITHNTGYYFLFAITMLGPLTVLLSDHRKETFKKFVIEWGSSILIYFVITFSSGGGASQASCNTIMVAVVSIKLMIEVIQGSHDMKFTNLLPYVMVVALILGQVSIFYKDMYRDRPYNELTEKVDSGVYKGIYTTPKRKRHIQDLEAIMKQIEDKGETVMILYHCCYAYLMVDMVPKIPNTWGCINYKAYGFDNQGLFMSYLSNDNNIPENVIIIDIPKAFDYAGQRTEIYEPYYPELNQFIFDHYSLDGIYEKGLSGQVIKYKIDQSTF